MGRRRQDPQQGRACHPAVPVSLRWRISLNVEFLYQGQDRHPAAEVRRAGFCCDRMANRAVFLALGMCSSP